MSDYAPLIIVDIPCLELAITDDEKSDSEDSAVVPEDDEEFPSDPEDDSAPSPMKKDSKAMIKQFASAVSVFPLQFINMLRVSIRYVSNLLLSQNPAWADKGDKNGTYIYIARTHRSLIPTHTNTMIH